MPFNRVNDSELAAEIIKLREQETPFAAISFRVPTSDKEHEKYTDDEKDILAHDIERIVKLYISTEKVRNLDLGTI